MAQLKEILKKIVPNFRTRMLPKWYEIRLKYLQNDGYNRDDQLLWYVHAMTLGKIATKAMNYVPRKKAEYWGMDTAYVWSEDK